MKIIVDRDKCVSLGICEGHAPNVFFLNDDGELEADETNPIADEELESVRSAVSGCPVNALRIVEDDTRAN